eukprot:TRINITY_DN59895_c0_g2_i1.p1 TRINITY_DN59895_c0_g2~~TRINITY_DN59895_c0_g2_i1.p1  ORF type:complete len:496 (-),score=76.55 TRINITY_DN59895_c0_g2_i1:157-1446(-)
MIQLEREWREGITTKENKEWSVLKIRHDANMQYLKDKQKEESTYNINQTNNIPSPSRSSAPATQTQKETVAAPPVQSYAAVASAAPPVSNTAVSAAAPHSQTITPNLATEYSQLLAQRKEKELGLLVLESLLVVEREEGMDRNILLRDEDVLWTAIQAWTLFTTNVHLLGDILYERKLALIQNEIQASKLRGMIRHQQEEMKEHIRTEEQRLKDDLRNRELRELAWREQEAMRAQLQQERGTLAQQNAEYEEQLSKQKQIQEEAIRQHKHQQMLEQKKKNKSARKIQSQWRVCMAKRQRKAKRQEREKRLVAQEQQQQSRLYDGDYSAAVIQHAWRQSKIRVATAALRWEAKAEAHRRRGKRVFNWMAEEEKQDKAEELFVASLAPDADYFNEYDKLAANSVIRNVDYHVPLQEVPASHRATGPTYAYL